MSRTLCAICATDLSCRDGYSRLRAIILADADGTVTVEAVGPETTQLNIALAQVGMGKEEPGTEDTLGKDIQNGISDDLAVNTNLARTIGETPDTRIQLVLVSM